MPVHNLSIGYAAPPNGNMFNILQIVDPGACLLPTDTIARTAVVPQRKTANAAPQGPKNVDEKKSFCADQRFGPEHQHNSAYRRNMNQKFPRSQPNNAFPMHGEAPPSYQAATRPQFMCAVPPRFQTNRPQSRVEPQGFCAPINRPLSGVKPQAVAPISGDASTHPDIEFLNAQLKQSVLLGLQKQQCGAPSRPAEALPIPRSSQPMALGDSAPDSTPRASVYNASGTSNQRSNTGPSSTPKQGHTTPVPDGHDVLSRPPTDPSALVESFDKVNVSLPHPPGLPKPDPRRKRFPNRRNAPSAKPRSGEPSQLKSIDDASFERHNAIVQDRVISPPPSEASSASVRLPRTQGGQPVPRSPSTTGSSLASEDLSGGSSVAFSDTTAATSVASSASSKFQDLRRNAQICRRWQAGRSCFSKPCPYRHGEQLVERATKAVLQTPPAQQRAPRQPSSTSGTKPPPSSSTPTASTIDKYTTSLPHKVDASNGDAGPSLRPDPLYATTISDHIKVKLDQGFEVREVTTGFESRWVHLGNVAPNTHRALKKLLAPYQVEILNVPESSGKPMNVKVQFASAAEALKAVTELNGVEFVHRHITAKLAINNSSRGNTVLKDTDVQVVWECPQRVGYAGYATLKEAKAVIDTVNGFPMDYSVVMASLYDGLPAVGAYNVMLHHLPANTTEADLRKLGEAESIMLGRPNYTSLDKATKAIRSKLEEFGTISSFHILPSPFRDGMVKAWAQFTSPAEARAAQDELDNRHPSFIGRTTLSVRHVFSMSHVLTYTAYRKMREDLSWLRWSWQRRYGHSVSITERGNIRGFDDSAVFIRLSSEQATLLSRLKFQFEQLLQGETVTLDKKPAWDDFFTNRAGFSFISQLHHQYRGIQIEVHGTRRVLSLWGPIVERRRARQDIIRKVVELKSQQFWHIPLAGKLLGIFLSADLTRLQKNLGLENCVLDWETRSLVVRGNDETFRIACAAVQAAQSRQSDEVRSDVTCPVCFNEAVVPTSLECGHKWCRTCLTGYLTSAVDNKTFPLRCLGDEATCTHCIPLSLARKLLSAADFNALVEAAFWSYVHSRTDEFHHCPTPDCAQVYRSAPPNAVLQCPSCLVRICPACQIEYHDGLTCEERDVAEDKLFAEWTSSHDVKSCPGCKVPIERSEGCNHMTCGEGIYDHMRHMHGSIGL
ncbi:hypothetical protein HYDPIDRAFT_29094 [Hydnomerulius pinastri MD-312]|uniref:RBR-type E3 ubiquitin transferase n=1 Tax=Hydnomerulius pinastri MD-312 TaxID=994086 RepID=A0A0C9VZA7_9AGAM|nr:hypothetical protein HYDPIDRAFT_29094 [Hydnomerulius pinastri MD-312]